MLRRVGLAIPILIGISIGSFALIHLVPGDPARILLGAHASATAVAALRAKLSLNGSLLGQYWHFISNAVQFKFGTSIAQQTSVAGLISSHIMPTVLMLVMAVLEAVLVAVPLATVSALRHNRPADHAIRFMTMLTFGLPSFWLGLLLALVFGLKLHWLPTSGYGTSLGGHLLGLVLPSVTIALYLMPVLLRTLRSSMIETTRTEYIESARARGLSETRVMGRHVLRNSLIAMVTVLGVNVGFLLTGAVVVENVFAIPGLGTLLVSAVIARDFPVIQALTLFFGASVILINLATDISYALLDPRVRL